MKNSLDDIDRIDNRTYKIIYGMHHLIKYKASLVLLLIFVIIDVPLFFFDLRTLSKQELYITNWGPDYELIEMGLFLLIFTLFIIVNYPGKMKLWLKLAIGPVLASFCAIIYFAILITHLEPVFELVAIGLFLLVIISLFVVVGYPEEKRLKYKLVIALGIGSLWTFVYWIISYSLNWYILYPFFN